MSKQWGHGYNKGIDAGLEVGEDIGRQSGGFDVAEHCWHTINSAIRSIEQGNELEGLGILRMMKFMLAAKTGRDVPQ